jgi:uncharacterized protein YndB with AHSA1/START domain
MSPMKDELTLRKSVVVECPVEHAFRVFTERTGDWWPFGGHSIFAEPGTQVVFERRAGGRVYELSPSGEEGPWGMLTSWDPPNGFAMTWHPGRGEETAQELDVRFFPEAEATRVDLTHTGWARLGDRTTEAQAKYDEGWDFVLGRFAEAARKED